MTEAEKKILSVRFTPALHEALKAEAERLGITVNALMSVALDDWLRQRASL